MSGVSPLVGARSRTAAGLALLLVASLLLHRGAMRSGYWIDEAIAVGIASHPLDAIPRTLLLDGSPPLYYVLLHGWMALVGEGEAATRALSTLAALVGVPVALWAGRRVLDERSGWLAAGSVALAPFVGELAQETRMYTLVVLLSLVSAAGFVLAFVDDRPRHRWTFGVALALLLWTHNWSLFLAGGYAAAWVVLRMRRRTGSGGALVFAAVAAVYLPWLPSLLAQAAHTGAPWSTRPGVDRLLGVPVELVGLAGTVALVAVGALGLAARSRRRREDAERPRDARGPASSMPSAARNGGGVGGIDRRRLVVAVLLGVAVLAGLAAWVASQISPAWAPRYAAVLAGPLVLGGAGLIAGAGRVGLGAAVAVAVVWVLTPLPTVKSNARAVAERVAPMLRPGDVVVSTQPEQVPVLVRYLPRGVRFRTLTGPVPDPRVTDWRDGVARLRATSVRRDLDPVLAAMPVGARMALVTPIVPRPSNAPWMRAVRFRSGLWRTAVGADRDLRLVGSAPRSVWPRRPSAIRIAVYERVAGRAR